MAPREMIKAAQLQRLTCIAGDPRERVAIRHDREQGLDVTRGALRPDFGFGARAGGGFRHLRTDGERIGRFKGESGDGFGHGGLLT